MTFSRNPISGEHSQPVGAYPLTVPWLLLGGFVGMAISVLADDFLPGYAVFVLLAGIGLTWRHDDPPVFPFILSFQWLSVTVGYWFQGVTGYFPGTYRPGDVNHTVQVALTGLLLLALGIRLVYHVVSMWHERGRRGRRATQSWAIGNVRLLFFIVMAAYAIDYFWFLNTKAIPGLDVALQRVLDLRQVLLVALWVEVLRRREGYSLLLLSLGWAFTSRLGAYFSDFKSPLLLLLIVYAASFRPWERRWWPRSLLALANVSPAIVALLVLLLIWQGGLKRQTREAIDTAFTASSPVERVMQFAEGVVQELPRLFADPEPYVERLVERLSYITFFSLVLDHVPAREAHSGGEMLGLMLTNSTVPRYFFPEKPVLASDSQYTRRFAGVYVAEENTSISIGYMAEFYADWGYTGMWLSIFAYGGWIGLMAGLLRVFDPMPVLRPGVLIVCVLVVSDFEHQAVKGFAALNASVGFLLVLLFVLRPWLERTLGVTGTETAPNTVAPSSIEEARPSPV